MYLDALKKLCNAELVASMQYRLLAEALVGKSDNYSYIKEHCNEHADEEMEHYKQLVAALMERDELPDIDLSVIIKEALPKTEELTDVTADYALKFFIKAESDAIRMYGKFYDKIVDKDPDLADLINEIKADEREHRLDFLRVSNDLLDKKEKPEKKESKPAAKAASEKKADEQNLASKVLEDELEESAKSSFKSLYWL